MSHICTDPACPIRGITAATCHKCGQGMTVSPYIPAPIVGTDDTKAGPARKPQGPPYCDHSIKIGDRVISCVYVRDHAGGCYYNRSAPAPTDKPAPEPSIRDMIADAKAEVDSWPEWMRDAAHTAFAARAPRCSDGMACTMPGDCRRRGYCISDATDKPAPDAVAEARAKFSADELATLDAYLADITALSAHDASASVDKTAPEPCVAGCGRPSMMPASEYCEQCGRDDATDARGTAGNETALPSSVEGMASKKPDASASVLTETDGLIAELEQLVHYTDESTVMLTRKQYMTVKSAAAELSRLSRELAEARAWAQRTFEREEAALNRAEAAEAERDKLRAELERCNRCVNDLSAMYNNERNASEAAEAERDKLREQIEADAIISDSLRDELARAVELLRQVDKWWPKNEPPYTLTDRVRAFLPQSGGK